MKLSEDELKRLRKLREAVAGKEEDEDLEIEDGEPFPDIPDRTEQSSQKKEEVAAREKVSSPAFDLGKMLRRQMGISEEVQVREEPKVGKLRPEAIQALAKGSDIPIPPMMEPPPAPPLETRTTVAMDESSIPSAEKRKATVIEEPSIPSSERRKTTVSEIPAPPLEKRETTGKDTKPTNFDEVLNKAGVVLSPNDQTLITEAFHKVGIIDRVPKRDKLLSEQIALTVSTVVKNNPELQPFVTEICDAFVDKAKQDATRTALNDRFGQIKSEYQKGSKVPEKSNKDLDIVIKDLEELQQDVSGKIGPKNAKELASKIDKIKEDYNTKSGEEQTKTLYQNLQSLKDWSSEKGKETTDKSTWKKIGTVVSSCMSLVAAKIAGKEVETIKNNLAQAMKELKTQGKKEVVEGLSKINTKAAENQRSR
ncbi:MAG: hypothetical protein EBY20_07395 [Alphaproteobacteria bacterium]|nr:hypothetical protein [Alphaproteobacteria bacterium]